MRRVACVVQRYGSEVTGGAEAHARSICERLASELGWQVEVFTTTAREYERWQAFYPPGSDQLGPCRVHRFKIAGERHPLFSWLNRPLQWLARVSKKCRALALARAVEAHWLKLQGPYSPDLTEAVLAHQHEFEFVLFFTYLYATTQFTLPRVSVPTILVPTAHDEGPFYFLHTGTTLAAATQIYANTETEAQLITRIHPPAAGHLRVVGVGVELGSQDAQAALPDAVRLPYVIYCGRIGAGKNLDLLLRGMREFWRVSAEMQLVLCGALDGDYELPRDERIVYLGFVDEPTKLALIGQATCVVSASALESLSLLALEAFALKKPLLLNRNCPVFCEYANHAKSALLFDTAREFAEQLSRIRNGLPGEGALADSQMWANNRFSWHKILSAYKDMGSAERGR